MADDIDDDLGIDVATGDKADDKTDEPEWKPPTKEEWEKQQRALATANREAKDRREKLQELTRKTEDADGKAARERAEAAEAKYKPVAVRAAARAAFLEAGMTGAGADKVARLTRMLDLDAISINDDGDVVGLDAQVTALKADFPEMFGGGKQRAPRLDAGDRRPAPQGPKTSAERIAAQILGGAA